MVVFTATDLGHHALVRVMTLMTYLFQCLVVDKAGSILGNLELPLLYLLSELPLQLLNIWRAPMRRAPS